MKFHNGMEPRLRAAGKLMTSFRRPGELVIGQAQASIQSPVRERTRAREPGWKLADHHS